MDKQYPPQIRNTKMYDIQELITNQYTDLYGNYWNKIYAGDVLSYLKEKGMLTETIENNIRGMRYDDPSGALEYQSDKLISFIHTLIVS